MSRLELIQKRMDDASLRAHNMEERMDNIKRRLKALGVNSLPVTDMEMYERLMSTVEQGLDVTEESLGAFERLLFVDGV